MKLFILIALATSGLVLAQEDMKGRNTQETPALCLCQGNQSSVVVNNSAGIQTQTRTRVSQGGCNCSCICNCTSRSDCSCDCSCFNSSAQANQTVPPNQNASSLNQSLSNLTCNCSLASAANETLLNSSNSSQFILVISNQSELGDLICECNQTQGNQSGNQSGGNQSGGNQSNVTGPPKVIRVNANNTNIECLCNITTVEINITSINQTQNHTVTNNQSNITNVSSTVCQCNVSVLNASLANVSSSLSRRLIDIPEFMKINDFQYAESFLNGRKRRLSKIT